MQISQNRKLNSTDISLISCFERKLISMQFTMSGNFWTKPSKQRPHFCMVIKDQIFSPPFWNTFTRQNPNLLPLPWRCTVTQTTPAFTERTMSLWTKICELNKQLIGIILSPKSLNNGFRRTGKVLVANKCFRSWVTTVFCLMWPGKTSYLQWITQVFRFM